MCKKICITLSIILLILLCMGIPRSFAATRVYGPNCSTGHAYAKIPNKSFLVSAANCKSPAIYYYSCAICKVKSTQTFTYGPTGDHVPVKSETSTYLAKAATCTEPATYYYKCQSCNAVLKKLGTYSSGTTSGHSFGAWKTTKAATCTKNGSKTRICSVCGAKETATITASAHSYSSWNVTKAATCTASGSKTRKCSKCGNVQTETIAALGHKYSSWKITKNASCTSDGSQTRTCSTCGYKETQTIKAFGHDYSKATCTQAAKCSRCGQTGSALGHNYSKATCTAASKCTRCGQTSGKALGHNIVNGKCTRCGFVQETDKYSYTFDSSISSWVYVPHLADVKTYTKMPLIIYLHGGTGAWSKDALVNPANGGLPCYLKDGSVKVGALVVIPTAYNANIANIVSKLKQKYSINDNRISITGHSTGAYWAVRNALKSSNGYSTKTTVKFSVCVPVSYVNNSISNPAVDSSCAIRFIYESNASGNSKTAKEKAIANVNKAAKTRKDVTYYVMPNTKHDSVQRIYITKDAGLGMNILEWMAKQSL